MTHRRSLREVASNAKPLVVPTAQYAFTAHMIEHMGFKALALGGSTMLAARYGLPDLGLAGSPKWSKWRVTFSALPICPASSMAMTGMATSRASHE